VFLWNRIFYILLHACSATVRLVHSWADRCRLIHKCTYGTLDWLRRHVLALRKLENVLLAVHDRQRAVFVPRTNVPCRVYSNLPIAFISLWQIHKCLFTFVLIPRTTAHCRVNCNSRTKGMYSWQIRACRITCVFVPRTNVPVECILTHERMACISLWHIFTCLLILQCTIDERWEAGVEIQKNVRGEIGGWGRVPFNETYAPSLSSIYDGA